MATYLSRTPSVAGNRKTYIWSGWIKRSLVNGTQQNFLAVSNATNDFSLFYIDSNESLTLNLTDNGSYSGLITTNRKFRDTSAWYHIVLVVDTTQATASNRVKIYVNGVQETSFSTSSYPSQNYEGLINTGLRMDISGQGSAFAGGAGAFDGSMSHIHFIDGTAYDASAFGETDANGVWKIKTSPSVTYGTNGFFILKDGNSVTDQSGNGNNWSVGGGTLTNTEDNPSNVFATMNPLASSSTPIFGNGNNYVECNNLNNWNLGVPATLVMPSGGKFYWEVKNEDATYPNYLVPGFTNANYYSNLINGSGLPGNVYDSNNGFTNNLQGGGSNTSYSIRRAGSTGSTISDSFLNGDIMSFAVDLVNRKAWLGKNGTWLNSGDPVNGTNETWGTSDIDANTDYVPTMHYYYTAKGSVNFGNGYFKTTAVSSAGTNASGNGIFEYDVPSGYTALSTKGLNL